MNVIAKEKRKKTCQPLPLKKRRKKIAKTSLKRNRSAATHPRSQCEKEGEEKEGKGGHEKSHCRKELQKAKEEIEKLKAEAEDLKRKWYSVSAEYENYRRRTREESARKYTEGRNDVVSSLFAIGDNLERALSACQDEKTKEGIEMVLKSYKKVLESEKCRGARSRGATL